MLAVLDLAQAPVQLGIGAIAVVTLVIQLPAIALLVSRLLRGPRRIPPLLRQPSSLSSFGNVSILVPTLNEAHRLRPCLEGLTRQSYEVREILVVDSRSQDGTVDVVKEFQSRDPRFRLITDDPLPPGWVGRPWALHTGFLQSSAHSDWILGIDADTQPQPELVASLVQAATEKGYDLVSLAPRFILHYPGELLLQPALLITLLYRFGPVGAAAEGAERVMANGQCFLCRRSLLTDLGGYSSARHSFCDDVTLARYAASYGARVGFWDGSRLLKVRMYEGAKETWTEWGRSLDLKDACSVAQKWGDAGFLIATQALPLLLLPLLGMAVLASNRFPTLFMALAVNLGLVLIRVALIGAIAPSYDLTSAKLSGLFWLSPLADPLAVLRIILSSLRSPTQWRGRTYASKHPL